MNTKSKEVQEDIELLLPWHAAGTLSRRDAERVERALANDNELAARYELVREELGEAIRLNESLGAPSARAMQALFEKIDAEPVRKPKASFDLGAWLSNFVAGFSPRTLAYGATAAALAIVLQAGLIAGVLIKEQQAGPQLASFEQNQNVGAGSFVLIRFNPQANAADITKFLQENKAIVVGGPAAGSGMYRLRVAETTVAQAELAAIVKRMAANPVVGLTVPAAQP
jgi:anti-sigma-K factor RskA